jgi:hypothetical protein
MVHARTIYCSSASCLSIFRSLQRIAQLERNHVRELIRDRVQNHSFREYFSVHYDISVEQLASHSTRQHLDLIAMKVYRIPDGMYPGLSCNYKLMRSTNRVWLSIFSLSFAFLEEASSIKTSSWIASQLYPLNDYILSGLNQAAPLMT